MSLSSALVIPGVGDGAASASGVASLTCESGEPISDAAAPPGGVIPGVVVVLDTIWAEFRFGSVHCQSAAAVMCGSACARISMMTPFVRLISCSAMRRVGLRWSAVRMAWSSVKRRTCQRALPVRRQVSPPRTRRLQDIFALRRCSPRD